MQSTKLEGAVHAIHLWMKPEHLLQPVDSFFHCHDLFLCYKGWLRITEQTLIADRQCLLSISGKSPRIPWFISYPTSACWGWSVKQQARYRHVRKTTSGTAYGEHSHHTHAFQAKFLRYSVNQFTWNVQGLSKSSNGQMPVFFDHSGDGIDVGRCHNCSWHTPCSLNSADSSRLQRLYATTKLSNQIMFPSKVPLLVTQLFHSHFF